MNIFQVLSQGKSRLNEPSMSAMLGYLFDSNEDHGLGDTFVRAFLMNLDQERFSCFLKMDFIDAQSELEVTYSLGKNPRAIDIEISVLDSERNLGHRFIIENKIKVGAANPKQLKEYYQAILQDDSEAQNVCMVFLTPSKQAQNLKLEFDNLVLNDNPSHSKYWVHWDKLEGFSIVSILRQVLKMESLGEINPINEYMRHTLKAFIRHALNIMEPTNRSGVRRGEDIGTIVEEAVIQTKHGSFQLLRRDSTQIQVFNLDSGDKEVARYVLSDFIDENSLGIAYAQLNTRQIGQKVFAWLSKQQSKN